MRSPVLTIFKKELARFFGDRRMALTTILLPGLMIYVLYTFMGNALSSQFSVEDTYRPTAVVENLPDSLSAALSQALEIQEEAEPMELVRNQKLDLYIRFPAGFDEAVAAYDMASGKVAPQVEVYYNSAAATSGDGYNLVLEILNQYESSLVNKFHVNWNGIYDLATQEDATGSIFSLYDAHAAADLPVQWVHGGGAGVHRGGEGTGHHRNPAHYPHETGEALLWGRLWPCP